MIICILQKGTTGTLLYLNSQEEQIILDHVSHTDQSQLKPEQWQECSWECSLELFASALWGTDPVWAPALAPDVINTNTTGVLGKAPCWITNIHDRPCCTWFLSKLHKTGAKGDQCLYISDLYSQEFSNRYVYLYRTETSRSRDIWRFSSIHRKGKIIFLLNKLRNVNSVTSLKKLSQYL